MASGLSRAGPKLRVSEGSTSCGKPKSPGGLLVGRIRPQRDLAIGQVVRSAKERHDGGFDWAKWIRVCLEPHSGRIALVDGVASTPLTVSIRRSLVGI